MAGDARVEVKCSQQEVSVSREMLTEAGGCTASAERPAAAGLRANGSADAGNQGSC